MTVLVRVRPLYASALLLALLGLAAYLVVPPYLGRRDRAAVARANAIVAALRAPAGATERSASDCHGDNLRCYHVARGVDEVAAEMAAALRTASGEAPDESCDEYTHPRGLPMRSCVLHVWTAREHAAVVMVTTAARRVDRAYVADGTYVHVSAG